MSKVNGRPALPPASLRKNHVKAGPGTEEQFLNVGAAGLLQPAPLLDRYKYCGLNAAACDDLRALRQGGIKELAKAGFRVLQLPGTHKLHL
jgi:hypothetical protein